MKFLIKGENGKSAILETDVNLNNSMVHKDLEIECIQIYMRDSFSEIWRTKVTVEYPAPDGYKTT